MFKVFKYRIFPSKHQQKTLNLWNISLVSIWNLANEQREFGLSKPNGFKKFYSEFEQQRQLSELRAIDPKISNVPRHACDRVLHYLDKAWGDWFSKNRGRPRYKKPSFRIGITETDVRGCLDELTIGLVKFPKLGKFRVAYHRNLFGTPRSFSLKPEGDQWFVTIVCEAIVSDPKPRTEPVVAIDRGIAKFGATSSGAFIENPQFLEKSLKKLARAQRASARKQKGSANQKKAKLKVAKIHRKIRRQREHFLHVETAKLAKTVGTAVLEKLQIENMVKNRKLARSIASAGWGKFATYLKYKLEATGGRVVEVPAQFSSQTCSACGYVSAENRLSQAEFACKRCDFRDNADVNAAKVLLSRYYTPGNPWCQPVEGSASKGTRRSRKRTGLKAPDEQPCHQKVGV